MTANQAGRHGHMYCKHSSWFSHVVRVTLLRRTKATLSIRDGQFFKDKKPPPRCMLEFFVLCSSRTRKIHVAEDAKPTSCRVQSKNDSSNGTSTIRVPYSAPPYSTNHPVRAGGRAGVQAVTILGRGQGFPVGLPLG